MDIIKATKYIENGVLMVSSQYNIVKKEDTIVLRKIINECKAIYEAYEVMSFPLQEDIIPHATMICLMNKQIDKKLRKLYRYYHRHYGLTFDNGDWGEDNCDFSEQYRREKSTENNIALICEAVKSWEN